MRSIGVSIKSSALIGLRKEDRTPLRHITAESIREKKILYIYIGSFSLRQRASMRSMMRVTCRRSLPMDPSLLWRTRRLMWMIHAQLRWLSSHKLFSFLSPGVCSSLWCWSLKWCVSLGVGIAVKTSATSARAAIWQTVSRQPRYRIWSFKGQHTRQALRCIFKALLKSHAMRSERGRDLKRLWSSHTGHRPGSSPGP